MPLFEHTCRTIIREFDLSKVSKSRQSRYTAVAAVTAEPGGMERHGVACALDITHIRLCNVYPKLPGGDHPTGIAVTVLLTGWQ